MVVESIKADTAGVLLTLAMSEQMESRLSALGDGLSEYCYSNLYLFRHTHRYRLQDGDYPCIAGTTYDAKRYLMPLFSLADIPPEKLTQLLGDADFFFPVSEEMLARLDPARFEIGQCRDDADYLYPAENFIHYSGEKLRKKKNLMKQYLRGGTTEVRRFTPEYFDDARQVLEGWQQDKQKAPVDTDYHPCCEALRNSEILGMTGFIHYRDREPSGFLLGKVIWPGVFAVHFAKGSQRHNGIFQYMFHHLAKQREEHVHFYNFEQDLGLVNFRKTKQSYSPYRLLRKYRLKPRS
jgi:hypothetical protein